MFRGIGFDLDGTLYPNYRLYFRVLPSLLPHFRFFAAFSKVRSLFHRRDVPGGPDSSKSGPDASETGIPDFYETQALLMGKILKQDPRRLREKAETLIYRGWEAHFSRIRPFPHLKETLKAFRGAGLRLGVLSDFPPERKLELLGLGGLFDTALSSEKTGSLKPQDRPFLLLARELGLDPAEILYVGNSPGYDAEGALAAGMGAALIRRNFLSTGLFRTPAAPAAGSGGTRGGCFIFSDYRQLRKYVLG
ncbi:MAG: HAD family hydrolase [Treponema sp.]|nr:HAD family hydrolase [Treponema sp.]